MNFQKIRTIGFAATIFVALCCVWFVYAKYSALNQSKEQMRSAEENLQRMKIEVAQVEQLLEDYEKEKKDFSDYLFSDRNIPSFLDEISKMAGEAKIDIVNMKTQDFRRVTVSDDFRVQRYGTVDKPLDPTEESVKQRVLTLSAMPISISLKGEFKNLAFFLQKIQLYKQLVNIADMNMSQSGDKYPVLNCSFTLNIYSIKALSELKR